MSIIIELLSAFLFSYLCGYGIVGLFSFPAFSKKKFQESFLIIPTVGYSVSQLLFWSFYLVFQRSLLSFYLTIFVIILINALFIYYAFKKDNRFFKGSNWIIPEKEEIYLAVVLTGIFIISSWQYLLIGEGYYYHSANPDFFDAINGGIGYLKNAPLGVMEEDFSINFPLQYSSQTFWHILLRNDWVDGLLIQAILNLFLTSTGIYWLVKRVFKIKNKIALWAAFWATAGNFYLSTFYNGHVGSLMYIAIVPVLLGLLILWSRKEIKVLWLILAAILLTAIQYTYAGPVNFILIPAAVLVFIDRVITPLKLDEKFFNYIGFAKPFEAGKQTRKINWLRLIIVVIAAIALILAGAWLMYIYFAPRRLNALVRTAISWKIALYKEMLMIFWGIYPSGSSGSFSLIPLFASNPVVNNIALVLAAAVTCITAFAAFQFRKMRNRFYLFIFALFFIPFFIMMRYFWGSSYFFYKFLYTNYFLLVIAVVVWVHEIRNPFRRIKFIPVAVLFLLLGVLNIAWNFATSLDFRERIYHQKDEIKEFVSSVSQKKNERTYLDIPVRLYNKVFRYILEKNNIKLTDSSGAAKYLIQMQELNQAAYNTLNPEKVLYSNNILKFIVPNEQNKISIETQYPPEFNGDININWVGNQLTLQKKLLEDYVMGVKDYISENKLDGQVFIDIFTTDLNDFSYLITYDILQQNNVNVQKNVNKALYFLRIRGDQEVYKPLFGQNENERTVWQNDFFKIVYLPKEKRAVSNISPNYDYSGLFNSIKATGKKVYLDIQQDDDMLLVPLKQKMSSAGIKVTENPDSTTLICRYYFYPPLAHYNNYVLSNSYVTTVYRSNNRQYNTYPWDVELLDMPLKGRSIIARDFRYNSRERFLTGKRREDFKCSFKNLSNGAKYVNLIVAPGPSIDYADFNFVISSNSSSFKKVYKVSSPLTKIVLNVSELKAPDSTNVSFSLTGEDLQGQNLIGHSLLPLDDRYLLYNVMAIELTDNISTYSNNLVKVFNCQPINRIAYIIDRIFKLPKKPDIISKSDKNKVHLGIDWYQYETYKDESFRWVGKDTAEILLNDLDIKTAALVMNLEPGPACGTNPLKLDVLYNNKKIQSETINGRNNFTILLPREMLEGKPGQKVLKIVSNGTLKLPFDPRVLSYRVFSISLNRLSSPKGEVVDEKFLDKIVLGKGWYSSEKFKGESFRWAGKDTTEIMLFDVDNKYRYLTLMVEPGAGCGNEPLKLKAIYKGKVIQTETAAGRKNIEIKIPRINVSSADKEITLKLLSENGNYKIASDPRILNYRVLNLSFKKPDSTQTDIIDLKDAGPVQLGSGWYSYENYENKTFRWVGKDPAEILIDNPDTSYHKIKINLETGASCAGSPLQINIMVNNMPAGKKTFTGQQELVIDLKEQLKKSANGQITVKLYPQSKNAAIENDNRILNFRVFNISLIN